MFVPWTSASTGGKPGDMSTIRAGSAGSAFTGLATCVVVMADSAGIARLTVPPLAAHRGRLLSTSPNEQVVAVFSAASDAAYSALAVRAAAPAGIRVGLHTGYFRAPAGRPAHGPAIRRCERLAQAATAGQILVSAPAAATLSGHLPAEMSLHELGRHRLADLAPAERIFELQHVDADAGPMAHSLDAVPNNLPVQLTGFVGRQQELAKVGELLGDSRLVTLTGTGGVGKTRLAMQAAAELADRWPDGVWWVDLAAVTDAAEVGDAVVTAVGGLIDRAGRQVRSLAVQLRDHKALVCLDNCEHVIEGIAELAEELVHSCPELTLLVTSREPINVPGEITWQVPPLGTDEALSLFAERAAAVLPYFAVDEVNEPAIRSMCVHLDGIPLAVELAAAWVRTLTPTQVDASLDDRFALLVRSPRGAPARHQTLAASIDWSHNLLDDVERRVFRRLAVFPRSFDLEAVLAVCSDEPTDRAAVMQAVGRLVDTSLVVTEEQEGRARYRLLETIRAYAAERLKESEDDFSTRERHLDHYLKLAEAAEPELDHDKDAWLAKIGPERDNFRSALDWSLAAAEPDRGRRLAAALSWMWNLHATGREGVAYLKRAIDRAPADRSLLQARLFTGYAQVADTAAPFDFDAAERGLDLATELGDDRLRSRCLTFTALSRLYTDADSAWSLGKQAYELAEVAGDGYGRDATRALLGLILTMRDRHDAAALMLRDAADGLIRRGDRGIAATVLVVRSNSAVLTGQLAAARRFAELAVQTATPLGDYFRVGMARGQLATVLGICGDLDAALRLLEPLVRLIDGDPDSVSVPGLGMVMGELHRRRGDSAEALRWLERDLPKESPAADTYLMALLLPPYGAALRAAGRRDEAAELLERAATLAQRFDLPRYRADALEQLGYLAEADDPDRAANLHHEALTIRVEHGLRLRYVTSLEALGSLMAQGGRPVEAVRVLAASDQARRELGCPAPPAEQPALAALVDRLRSHAGFEAAWSDGAGLSLDDAVAYARRMRGARGRPQSGWASLTPTELKVVQLASDGLSNPEIGARLFMSRSTVKTHLSRAFAKLGVSNRTELAAIAATRSQRHG
jgi:predicted ATPase/DNA-binding CsgD family transcriptional regulator